MKYPGMKIDSLDYYSIHSFDINPLVFKDKPVILQEYLPLKPNTTQNITLNSKNYPTYLEKAKDKGYSGFMPWCFSSPINLYKTEGISENWESRLGVFQRADGTLKN